MSARAVRIEATILVKASPVLTSHLEESVCVAGIRTDTSPYRWVRLHPVPFRDLLDDQRFMKYQRLSVDVLPPVHDRRPESCRPIDGTISLGETLTPSHGWASRRALVAHLGEITMCELVAANSTGSGRDIPSLGVVRPAAPPKFSITERDQEQVRRWKERAEAIAGRRSLFDSLASRNRPELDVVPWRFQYEYRCPHRGCNGHRQTIIDWEAVALWRHVKAREDWRDLMVDKFERQMWHGRDTVLFVGNQEQRPQGFLVLGVFWPPDGDLQGVLAV